METMRSVPPRPSPLALLAELPPVVEDVEVGGPVARARAGFDGGHWLSPSSAADTAFSVMSFCAEGLAEPADFENGRMLDRPVAPYNSSLPETMDRQVREAKDAGIDAFIAAWDAKFVYWSERPDQAIRRMVDPNWSPLIATPPFPGSDNLYSYIRNATPTSALARSTPRPSRRSPAPSRSRPFRR